MKQQFEERLSELRVEFESGQKMMANLESKQANLRDTMMRISGAIQVLEELIVTESSIGEMSEKANQNLEIYADKKTETETEVIE